MIALTSEQDKAQLKEHALELLKQDDFEGLIILVEVLRETNFKLNSALKESFLKKAAKHGHLEIVKYLVEHGVDIHTQTDYALRFATEKGHLGIVKYLIENGADIHANNDFALRWAAFDGYLEIVKYLVEHGADIHAANDSALKGAAEYGHTEVVEYLEGVLKNDRSHQ